MCCLHGCKCVLDLCSPRLKSARALRLISKQLGFASIFKKEFVIAVKSVAFVMRKKLLNVRRLFVVTSRMGSVSEEKNAILCMKLKRQNRLGLPAIMLFLSALILFLFQFFIIFIVLSGSCLRALWSIYYNTQ